MNTKHQSNQKWTAIAHLNRSGSFNGRFDVLFGDLFEEDDPNLLMGNFYILGVFQSEAEANTRADEEYEEYWQDEI